MIPSRIPKVMIPKMIHTTTKCPEQQPMPRTVQAEKPRFGINSLINRMTGQGTEQRAPSAPAGRATPPMQSLPQELPEDEAELDKIEIPAFLRRQAN